MDMTIHNKFVELLPELNAASSYGDATSIIRKNLDKNFGKQTEDVKKTWQITLRCVSEPEYHSYTIEAWSESEAIDEAVEAAEDEGDYEDIDVSNIKEIV